MPVLEQREDRKKGNGRRKLRRGAYLLPSLFTIGNILLGFYAVVRGLRGDFQLAAILVAGAAVLDSLDGRLARLTGTESDFGREFDSLADVLTFGFVPALLAYSWGLQSLGRIGWLAPLFYLVCCATRLARYNVKVQQVDRRYFVGIPAPAAACMIAALLLFAPENDWKPWGIALVLVSLLVVGGLMVSTFRYLNFGSIGLRRRWSYRGAILWALGILVFAFRPTAALLAAAAVYTLYPLAAWVVHRLKGRRRPLEAGAESSDSTRP
jgi:CDP-diacylglycerol--serine O-phosphatidyltransferase